MADCSRDDDRIWRAAFREGYRRRPRVGELERYKYWHGVSRRDGFDAAGPWECWPSRPIPVCDWEPIKPIVEATASSQPVKTDPEPNIDEPVDQAKNQLATDGQQLSTEKPAEKSASKAAAISKPTSSARTAAANARRRGFAERARQLLRAQLSDGPRAGAEVEAAAQAAEISERSLIRATDVLGVRTQRGRWWLPGCG
jgi:hypothetical protein